MVHAVLSRVGGAFGDWHLEALSADPAVLVNGEVVRECQLRDGDLIGLAGVNLVFAAAASRSDAPALDAADEVIDDADDIDLLLAEIEQEEAETIPMNPAAMSASELVDALEADLDLIGELSADEPDLMLPPPRPVVGRDPHRVRGLASLLRAAAEFEDDRDEAATIPMRRGVIHPSDAERRAA